ncbi:MAG: AmpE protein [Bermanella sp.]|jgi:AmpE protein
MKFIVLLFTILLQKKIKKQGYRRRRNWFSKMAIPIKSMMGGGASEDSSADIYSHKGVGYEVLAFLLLVLLPGLVVGLTIDNLQGLSGTLVALLLSVALLLYILGRDDFSQKFDEYKECWLKEDYQGAFECADGFLDMEDQVMPSPCELHHTVSKAVVYAWFLRFFVFVFWYLALGIGGALASLLCYWFYREFKFEWAKNVIGAIEWPPSRLLALTSALAGKFTSSFPVALKSLIDFQTPPNEVLFQVIFPNMIEEQEFDCSVAGDVLQETNQVMFRSAVIWLVLVALLTTFTGF